MNKEDTQIFDTASVKSEYLMIPVYYNLGPILAIISITHDNIIIVELIAKIYEYSMFP